MVRIVKEYDERYAEFLQTAQKLFYQKGYAQTSVQEIIRTVGVAKGTFYHYFDSKAALLDELVEQMVAETLSGLEPMVEDPDLDALTKFVRLFANLNTWKLEHRDFFLEAARVLYMDENVLLRTKLQSAGIALVSPLLAAIIRQGNGEGVFDMSYPDEAAEILMRMGQGLSEALMPLALSESRDEEALQRIEEKIQTYERSVERVLGAAENSLKLLETKKLAAWLPES